MNRMDRIVLWLCVIVAVMGFVSCERREPKVDPLPAWATYKSACGDEVNELKCRESQLLDSATMQRNACEFYSNYIERGRCRSRIDSDYKERLAKLREEYDQ